MLPLLNDILYTFYKPIPIPFINGKKSTFIITESEYLAVNIIRDTYLKLNNQHLKDCTTLKNNRHICNIKIPAYSIGKGNVPCELGFIINSNNPNETNCNYDTRKCNNEWIALHRQNAWLYVCCDMCQLHIICQESMIMRNMSNTGIVDVGQGCTIKKDGATMHTNAGYQSQVYINKEVTIIEGERVWNGLNNLTKLTKIRQYGEVPVNHTHMLIKLQTDIDNIKREQDSLPEELSIQDIHQYAVSYTTLGLVVFFIVVAGCILKHLKNKKNNATSGNRAIPVEIEMKTIPMPQTLRSKSLSELV